MFYGHLFATTGGDALQDSCQFFQQVKYLWVLDLRRLLRSSLQLLTHSHTDDEEIALTPYSSHVVSCSFFNL